MCEDFAAKILVLTYLQYCREEGLSAARARAAAAAQLLRETWVAAVWSLTPQKKQALHRAYKGLILEWEKGYQLISPDTLLQPGARAGDRTEYHVITRDRVIVIDTLYFAMCPPTRRLAIERGIARFINARELGE